MAKKGFFAENPQMMESQEYRQTHAFGGLGTDSSATTQTTPSAFDQFVAAAEGAYTTVTAAQANAAATQAKAASSTSNLLVWGGVAVAAIALLMFASK